ncbi:MAG: hypothetical protein M0Q38_09035 [Bacteroidales bacterium]|jgi:hypothetical protein|nr:hypothetical protein [Bacteroidales bacterium]
MKQITNALFVIFFLLLLISCRKEYSPTPFQTQIFPLNVGNHWTFQTTIADSTHTIHVNDVLKDTLINQEQWFILTYDTVIRTVCRNTARGWWYIFEGKSPSVMKSDLFWKYPSTVNDQYLTADSSYVTIVSVNETVKVPAGIFNCYHYHMVHYKQGYECEEYLAPGYGLVKHTVYAPGTGTSKIAETTELVSYKLY